MKRTLLIVALVAACGDEGQPSDLPIFGACANTCAECEPSCETECLDKFFDIRDVHGGFCASDYRQAVENQPADDCEVVYVPPSECVQWPQRRAWR